MDSRERVMIALEHRESDRIPLDIGATPVSGMHVQSVYRLRQALALDPPGTPVKIIEPYQNLGEIKPDLMDVLGIDVAGISPPGTLFGFKNEDWKSWTAFDGTPVLVPGNYNTTPETNGDDVRRQVLDRIKDFGPGGGFVFNTIHNVQPQVPVENLLALFDSLNEHRGYPL